MLYNFIKILVESNARTYKVNVNVKKKQRKQKTSLDLIEEEEKKTLEGKYT